MHQKAKYQENPEMQQAYKNVDIKIKIKILRLK